MQKNKENPISLDEDTKSFCEYAYDEKTKLLDNLKQSIASLNVQNINDLLNISLLVDALTSDIDSDKSYKKLREKSSELWILQKDITESPWQNRGNETIKKSIRDLIAQSKKEEINLLIEKLIASDCHANYKNFKEVASNFKNTEESELLQNLQFHHQKSEEFKIVQKLTSILKKSRVSEEQITKDYQRFIKNVLLSSLLWNISLLYILVEIGEYAQSHDKNHWLKKHERQLFVPVLTKYVYLYKVLQEAGKQLSHKHFEMIANYAIDEAEKTLQNPHRSPIDAKNAADDLINNLTSPPSELPVIIRTIGGALVCAIIGALIGGFIGGLFGGPLGALVVGAFGFALGAILGTLIFSNYSFREFKKSQLLPYKADQKVLSANAAYAIVNDLETKDIKKKQDLKTLFFDAHRKINIPALIFEDKQSGFQLMFPTS
jgi:hypothetical protein